MAPKDTEYAPGHTAPSCVEDWAFDGHLTLLQKTKLDEFREALKTSSDPDAVELSTLFPDVELLRFMRAREFNLKKAMKMVMEDLEWRRTAVAGKRLTAPMFPYLMQCQARQLARICGVDKAGRPIIWLKAKEFVPRQVRDMMELLDFFIYYVEALVQHTIKLGFTEFVGVVDLEGWTLGEHFSISVSQLLAQNLQDHFPERLRYAFVLNNPWAFSAAWNLISPFLEDRVKAKVHVWGRKHEKLLQYIDADVLEKQYGGKHEGYAYPDAITAPLVEGKAFTVSKFIGVQEEAGEAVSESQAAPVQEVSEDADQAVAPPVHVASSPSAPAKADEPPTIDVSALTRAASPSQREAFTPRRMDRVRAFFGKMFLRKRSNGEFAASPRKQASDDALVVASPTLDGTLQHSSSSVRSEDRPPLPKQSSDAELTSTTHSVTGAPTTPMSKRQRMAVFGATGRLGKAIALEALESDWDVSVLARPNGSRVAPELMQYAASSSRASASLSVFVGEPTNAIDLHRVLEGVDVVVCAMGAPVAMTGGAVAFLPETMNEILRAMQHLRLRRIVVVSDAMAGPSWWESSAGVFSNLLTKPLYWQNHYSHYAKMEELLATAAVSGAIDLTVLRPGTLQSEAEVDGERTVRVKEGFVFDANDGGPTGPGAVTRAELAEFIVREASDNMSEYLGKSLAIGAY